jgi:hypothetical protein
MQNNSNKCDPKCPKIKKYIDDNIMKCESIFDLVFDLNEFIKNCECEEKENEFEEDDK